MLRCRENSHEKFAKLRKDVIEKLELLDQKHGLLNLEFHIIAYRVKVQPCKLNNVIFGRSRLKKNFQDKLCVLIM